MTGVLVAPFSAAWREEGTQPVAIAQSVAIADPFTPIYRRGDVVIAWMVAAHLALAALLAPIYGTWQVTAVVGIGAAALYYLCMAFAGGRFLTRNVAGLTLQTFCALHIYQMKGLAEMHFFFFTAVTAMIIYQDWRAMWLGVLAIIAQHSLFSLWHNEGVHPGGMAFFEPSHVSLLKISFHFGIALVQVAFAAWCARLWRLNTERGFALAATNDRLREQESRLEKSNGWLSQRAASLEEQLRQSRKMDAVGRLAGGVAHDFNNLLTVIQAHAEFARSEGGSEATRVEDIDQILRAADSGARLTRQLLTFSQKQMLAPTSVDLNSAIRELLAMVTRLVGGNIEITTVAGRELSCIWADPGQIQQVLLNLVVNARDAMPNGGRLRLETANVAVGDGHQSATGEAIPPGDYVMMVVEDTGTGMTEDVRRHIFEAFFTTKEAGRGTGLGLATVGEIVRQANGHISVHSEPGIGTTFKVFFLPHHAAGKAPEARASGETRPRPAAGHVLIVEDEPNVRAAFCRALAHVGYICTEARNAAEALEILERDGPIDLMITDMVMPGMSGVALVAQVRRTHPTLPVLILSGYSEEAASPNWRVPDEVAFVEKPVTPTELIRHVRQILEPAGGGH